MHRARECAGMRMMGALVGAGAIACLAGPSHAETAFDKAMKDMGQLHFVESYCADTMVVVITDPTLEGFYKEAVKVRPGAFKDALSASEKSLGDSEALAAACSRIFDRFNGPEIFVNNKD
jgi:hypothetical protein